MNFPNLQLERSMGDYYYMYEQKKKKKKIYRIKFINSECFLKSNTLLW